MSVSLFNNPISGIYKNQCYIGSRCSGNHIPCVLNMSRSVGDNKFSLRGGEVAIGYINSNSLFPLCPEAVS